MNFQNRVRISQDDLTAAESKVAQYVLEHPEETVNYSVDQLAKLAGASSATVVRMVKKLDIDSFTAMKIMLSMDLVEGKEDDEKQLDIKANESFGSIRDKLAENETKNIEQTKSLLKSDDCNKAVNRLKQTNTLYVFGVGASSLAAENIRQKWARIGLRVVVGRDVNVFLTELSNATKDDTLWLVSNSGETPEILYVANYAKESGLFLITLTMFGQNHLAKLGDVSLKTIKPMEPDVRVGATNSITGQFFVIDVILYLYFSQDFDRSFAAITASKRLAKNYKSQFKN
ncbi:MAG: MurR/RpiR family transcriptional regulator [Lactobacillus sp.]|jgi:DNA-binding MurR/RpiR family transcriptional regulator|uniref:MurR/RpiR family transcriptional regulator n=1 Tax=Lacticaseibacillus suilingensis TaxID=2799577 RepID=A0ABW4BGB1_9LACO|nr:MurR/RpiR family transcriptional regulator [Lacticaseibacillus suilingensis]MCI1894192.1 MurR/RpiR family transcriptional regulator [Lactobacillus sp.]MCI1941584.1 MurR/RpiR family transcriptional regulator [Lactobacillus sp.]MCI1972130.1 MurR/RpiR family transcriptional regulator [Lactobacillus sp.]MCI2036791.1 MurR/RpiR family transcriptional regulator [Lactobacillus sp.]